MNKYSVFGGSGFIGGKFVSMYPEISYLEPRYSTNPKYDNIIYFIGSNTNYNMFESLTKDINDNLLKLNYILENCRNRDINITYISSWFAYGKLDKLPAKEEDVADVFGYYAICKKTAEQMLKTFCNYYNEKYKILRLANTVGKEDINASEKKNVLQHFIKEIKNNKNLSLYNGGTACRDFIHVEDVCKAVYHLLDYGNHNEVYNVGSGYPTVIRDALNYVIDKTKSSSKIEIREPSTFHNQIQIVDFWQDITKLKNTGFEHKYKNIYEILDTLI